MMGAMGVRYDGETGLYWTSVHTYDPALGRFLSHGPLYFQDLLAPTSEPR
jgi:hypothetical protein